MIYRLYTGADSQIKQRIISACFVLAVTIGFPVSATLLNHENLVPGPTSVVSNDSPGVVLGENTDTSSPDDSGTVHASTSAATTPIPKKKPMRVGTATPNAPLAVTTPVPPAPTPTVSIPQLPVQEPPVDVDIELPELPPEDETPDPETPPTDDPSEENGETPPQQGIDLLHLVNLNLSL